MGDPKLPRRNWRKPKRPLNYDLKMEELQTLGTFGLRTKRELWKARTELSRLRKQARALLALRKEERREREPVLLNSLARIGLVKKESTLDDVLNLQVTDLLQRRLQTVIREKLGFRTAYQARQAVAHGHITVEGRIIDVPSYVVTVDEEDKIEFAHGSTLKEVIERHKESEREASEREGEAISEPEDERS